MTGNGTAIGERSTDALTLAPALASDDINSVAIRTVAANEPRIVDIATNLGAEDENAGAAIGATCAATQDSARIADAATENGP